MSLSPRCFALAQITSLVANISKKNYKANCSEIAKLVDMYGFEADKHLFRCLVSSVDFVSEGRNSGKDGQQLQLLIQEANSLVTKPNFVSILCYSFEKQDSNRGLRPSSQLLSQVAKTLKLARVQEVVFALGLTNSSDADLKEHATQHLRSKLPELVRSYTDMSSGLEGGFNDLAIEVLHMLLSYLILGSEDELGVPSESIQSFIGSLRCDFPRERVPVVLAPLLYKEQQDITEDRLVPVSVSLPTSVYSIHLADIIKEIGYAATASKQEMLEILKDYGKAQINPKEVARVLGMMASTLTGLPEGVPFLSVNGDISSQSKLTVTWDVKVFMLAVQSMISNMNWREVILNLDYPEFYLDSPEGLSLIITGYKSVSRDPFPLETVYLTWSCTRGQLSLLKQAIKGCPEFSVAQFPLCTLKMSEEVRISTNSEMAKTWYSLSLIESLLYLADQGHYKEVLNIFGVPMQHCPEVLFLAIIRTQQESLMLQEIVSKLVPHFVSNFSSYASVLHEAWHASNMSPHIQKLLVTALSEWFMSSDPPDPNKILAILEMAKELKVLPLVLNAYSFPFTLELACWASKRDYLKLDKWIMDKLRDSKTLAVDAVHFIMMKAPQPLSPMLEKGCLTNEMVLTLLTCLNSIKRQDILEKLNHLISVHGPLPVKPVRPVGLGGNTMLELSGLGMPYSNLGGSAPLGSPGKNSSSLGLGGLNSASHFSGQQAMFGSATTPDSLGYLGSSGMGMGALGGGLGSGGGVGIGGANVGGIGMSGGMSMANMGMGMGAGTGMSGNHGKVPPQSIHFQPPMAMPNKPVSGVTGDQAQFGSEQSFSKEVDDKANSYFQAIYNRGMSVDRLLDELKKFKDSTNKKDRDLFMCMLRNMFDEYKFFPEFPFKELQITGQLFGGIIEHGLVTYVTLSLALRYVLQSLKSPPSSKMNLFGLAALDKFKKRLHEFSHYCGSIAAIPHFHAFPEQLKQYVHYGQQSMEPPLPAVSSSATPTGMQSLSGTGAFGNLDSMGSQPLTASFAIQPISSINTSTQASFPGGSSPQNSHLSGTPMSPHGATGSGSPGGKAASAGSPMTGKREHPSINNTNIDTLLVAADQQSEKAPPPEEVQDKIHFLFNNLSSANIQEKVDEARGLISEEHMDWVAGYLVMKRASIEPNFHGLYMKFLDLYSSSQLRKQVLRETYRNIKVILQADKTSNNFSDRAILKNLGHWLGMQTLAKNKPILHIDLAVKDLILEAHYKGQQELMYVVAFVAKVLESCADSRVFKPPNPWTMAIMSVLCELHAVPDLKLNLKFEVEVLCKHLSLEISDIPRSKLLGNTEKAKKLKQLSAPKEPSLVEQSSTVHHVSGPASSVPTAQSQFHVDDISVTSLNGLAPHLQISHQIALLQQYPQLKQCIKPSVEKAVQDLLPLVVERSIKVAITTTEHIIKKDFSLDPDIHRMGMAAQHMVQNLTAGMALITCREPLLLSINSNLKSSFSTSLRNPPEELKTLIDQAAQQISADNTELACAFIQKTSMEKAMPEMEKRLAEEFELRKMARNEGRRYCNTAALTYQAERMPEPIRLIVGGPSQQQAAVYEEFARSIPGFLPNVQKEGIYGGKSEFLPNDEFIQILMKCIQEINQHLRMALAPHNNPHVAMMRSLLEMTMQLRITQNHINVLTLLQKALEGLLEGMNPPPSDPDLFVSFRDCHLLILKMIQGHSGLGPVISMHHVTSILLGARDDIKYSPRAIILLIGMQIVDMKLLDDYLAKTIENGRHLMALSCSIKLVNAIMSAEKRETPITDKDLLKTKDTLYRLAANVKLLPDSSSQLLEPFRVGHDIQLISGGTGIMTAGASVGDLDRAPGAPTAGMMGPTNDLEDPPGLYEKVEYLLSEWVRRFHQPGILRDGDKIYAAYVARLQQQGILKSDDLITRFFRISIEMCVDLCYRTLNDQTISASMARAKCYHTMDAFVKLVVVLVRYSGDASTQTKVNLLNKVLVTVSHVLIQDHEQRHGEFHQLAYHRFFIMLLNDLSVPDPVFDVINFSVLHAFSHVFHIIRPSRAPGFAFSWLELISHRTFIAKLLMPSAQQKGWHLFHQLLIDLFKFLAPFLRNAELTKPTQLLYKGTLRVLLVLLHDFPEFLCDYHFSFCDTIPPNCIQMRNLILSAFPRNMRLPDPFTPNLKVEILPDISHAPRILPNYTQYIQHALKKDLDNYIRTRAPVSFLQELRGHLTVSNEPGNQYNVSLMNALVLYVGTQAIAFIHSKERAPSTSTIAHTAHMDIFQHLVVDLDTEGRYLFLNAIANQLRYPNSHTHFFSCALLSLFAETNAEVIQEQITRVLLERLIVNRPHPWGLLITFIELIKNTSYNFWKHEFVHCAPEIEKLFSSVAKSCMQKQPVSMPREEVHD